MTDQEITLYLMHEKKLTQGQADCILKRAHGLMCHEIADLRHTACQSVKTMCWTARLRLGMRSTNEAIEYVKDLMTKERAMLDQSLAKGINQ